MNDAHDSKRGSCCAMLRAATGHSHRQILRLLDLMTDEEISFVANLWEERKMVDENYRRIGKEFKKFHRDLMSRNDKPDVISSNDPSTKSDSFE